MDMGSLKYVFADATGPTSKNFSRNYRHFLWIDNVILIIDDVRAHEAGKFQWLLHYEGEASKRGLDLHLANGPAAAVVRQLFPETPMEMVEKEGLKDHNPDEKIPYFAFSPQESTRQAKFVTAILPMGEAGEEDLPRLERLQGPEMIGVRIHENEMITDVYLNLRADGRRMHRNSNNIFHGWETDAYLMAVTRPADSDENDPDLVERYFVACGSYLRKGGKVILDSLSKVYTVFTNGKPEMEVCLQGQPLMEVAFRSTQKPQTAKLNGKPVDLDYDEARKSVRFFLDTR